MITCLAVAAFATCAPAADVPCLVEPAHVRALAGTVTTNRYPDADLVWLSDRVAVTYEPDGTYVFRNEEWILPLTVRGARLLGSFSAEYNARFSDATIDDISFLGEDGALTSVPFRDSLKVSTDNCSLHANIVEPQGKKVTCSVPGVRPGTVVRRLRTERTVKSRLGPNWSLTLPLECPYPIVESLVTVEGPESLPVACAAVRNVISNSVVRLADEPAGDGRVRAAWLATNVPQTFDEPMMPPGPEALQTLRLSTFPDWPSVSRWYERTCAPHLAKTNAAMVAKVAELVRGAADDAARITALFTFVSQQVRYMGLTLEDDSPGYEPHDIDITFGNLYGVCRDKAALLAALLRLAGYEAYPALINSGAAMDAEIPTPYFNHAVVALDRRSATGDLAALGQAADARYLLLDPTDELTKELLPAYLAGMSYLVARPEGEALRTAAVAPPEENSLDAETDVCLGPDGAATVACAMELNGIAAARFRGWFASLEPDFRRHQLVNALGRGSGTYRNVELLDATFEPAELTDTSKPLRISARFRMPELVRRGTAADSFEPPFVTDALQPLELLAFATRYATRRFPLRFRSTLGAHERMTVRFADGLGAPVALPTATNVACGAWSYGFAAVATNGTLVIDRRERLADIRVRAEDYAALRAARADVAARRREPCLFAPYAASAANLRRRLLRHVSWVRGPYEWVSTNVEVTTLLAVGGKSAVAELRLPFNPPSRELRLVAAATVAADGTVHPIEQSAVNVLDSHAAASAPRYGNGRLLVADLPSVEVGSTVSTVVERVVHDAASPFFCTRTFAMAEPAEVVEEEVHFAPGLDPFVGLDHDNGTVETTDETGADGWRTVRWTCRRVAFRPAEWESPSAEADSPVACASLMDWEAYGRLLSEERAAVDGEDSAARARAREVARGLDDPAAQVAAVMRDVGERVRLVFPDAEWRQCRGTRFFSPDRSLGEGLASMYDRAALVAAMLDELGFDCEVRLAARGLTDRQFGRAVATGLHYVFAEPMVHAERRTGCWPFGSRKSFELSMLSSGYDLPTASAFADAAYFRPADGTFGRFVRVTGESADRTVRRIEVVLDEAGDAAIAVDERTYGSGIGAFRKLWREMTPEFGNRRHQTLAQRLAPDGRPVGEIVADVTGSPARLTYAAKVPHLAMVTQDKVTVTLPWVPAEFFPQLGAGRRVLPIRLHEREPERTEVVVRFPKGYVRIERLPTPFELRSPQGERWGSFTVSPTLADDVLTVTFGLELARPETTDLAPELAGWCRAWSAKLDALMRSVCIGR